MHQAYASQRPRKQSAHATLLFHLFRISAFYRCISEIVPRLLGPGPVIKKNGAQDCVDSTLIFRVFVTTAKLMSYQRGLGWAGGHV